MSALLRGIGPISLEGVANWERIAVSVVLFVVGVFMLRIVVRMLIRAVGRGLREQSQLLLRKSLMYVGAGIIFVMVLNAAGVSVGALLGAAGVVGIAVGIASQASLSNIISGLFLVSERFFEIGDIVRVGTETGVIASIDLLSIKIKTFNNLIIRIPNQQLIEQNIVNITRFPIRRIDYRIIVSFDAPIGRAIDALREAATSSPLALDEPTPLVLFQGFVENGVEFLLGVWTEKGSFVAVRNDVAERIQQVLRERGVQIRSRAVSILSEETMPARERSVLSRGN
jgi:small-conductance mechanosensitive channel